MQNLNPLFSLIRLWASDRNLIDGSTSDKQALKLISEFGEIGFAVAEGAMAETEEQADKARTAVVDGIGDTIVVLTIMAAQEGFNVECSIEEFKAESVLGYGFYQTASAIGRLGDAILKRNEQEIRAFTGYAIHHLAELADFFGVSLHECVSHAYNEIKDRKGVMYNGAFIKSDDARYEAIMAELGK